MAAGFRSPAFLLGLGKGSVGAGFKSPFFVLGLSGVGGAATTGGTKSFYGWWLGGFAGYATSTTSPWYFLKTGRLRRNG